jgi:hypothetical protein
MQSVTILQKNSPLLRSMAVFSRSKDDILALTSLDCPVFIEPNDYEWEIFNPSGGHEKSN